MIDRSHRSTSEAPAPTGQALRCVSALVVRAVLVAALAVSAGLVLVTPASAAAVDPEIAAVADQTTPAMPGVSLTVQTTSLGSQFVLENPTPTEVTIMSTAGDPLFRVGPQGVLGNFRSPDWYTSKTPDGTGDVPDRAKDKGAPVWARVSEQPAWGWFDQRLAPPGLTAAQKAATAPLAPFGAWNVAISYGTTLGSISGHYEYRPPLGAFIPEIDNAQPTPDVTVSTLQGDPTPGIAVENRGAAEVLVLGDAGEPYLRVTSTSTEANSSSPTWIALQDPGTTTRAKGDAAAPPTWALVGTSGLATFPLGRAGPAADVRSLYALTSPTVVRDWTVTLLVGGRRIDVTGHTTLTPMGYTGGLGFWAIAGIVAGAFVLLAAVAWLVLRRGRVAGRPPSRKILA